MKNFKKTLVACIFLLSGCAFSGKVWEPKYYEESFKTYFIDEDGGRVVLIGGNQAAFKGAESYHYLIEGDENGVKEVFNLGAQKRNLEVSFGYTEAKGSKVFPRAFWTGFDKKNLSSEEIEFLQNKEFKFGTKAGRSYEGLTLNRYPASKEKTKNYKTIPIIKKPGRIWEQSTPLQTTGKVLITPLTLAADILLLPITIPYFIYHQASQANSQHFCEGEFCDYEKIPTKNRK